MDKKADREHLGRLVRETWVAWAREQPSPKPSWLEPWERLSEPDREVDRRIGETLYDAGRAATIAALRPVSVDAILSDVCDLEPDDPDNPDTICVDREALEIILRRHIERKE